MQILASTFLVNFFIFSAVMGDEEFPKRPNIALILADDLGWNDVPWHDPQLREPSPNLYRLSQEGVTLNSHYVLPLCTPTRSALLTGRYPYTFGLGKRAFQHLEPVGVPLGMPFLSEELQKNGYSTHALGKWHLGYCSWNYTPTYRGFNTFRGFYLGSQDHYNHTKELDENKTEIGYDFRLNETVDESARGRYTTDIIREEAGYIIGNHTARNDTRPLFLYISFQNVHGPLQAPNNNLKKCKNFTREQKICGMLSAMDDAVGQLEKDLKNSGLWDNTLLIFFSDNGGQPLVGGSNWPLRGTKHTLWEGGMRVPTFVAGPFLNKSHYNSSSLMHVVDWYPTLLNLSGAKKIPSNLHGVNQWSTLNGGPPVRSEFVYNINHHKTNISGAIRVGDMKLIFGHTGGRNGWYNITLPKNNSESKLFIRNESSPPLLFNITDDPTERNDLAENLPNVTETMLWRLFEYAKNLTRQADKVNDTAGSPSNFNGTYSPGWCNASMYVPLTPGPTISPVNEDEHPPTSSDLEEESET